MSDASLRTTRFETGGCDIVHVYKDHGISGAKGRDKRPAFLRPLGVRTRDYRIATTMAGLPSPTDITSDVDTKRQTTKNSAAGPKGGEFPSP
jgi:hypothetical protein